MVQIDAAFSQQRANLFKLNLSSIQKVLGAIVLKGRAFHRKLRIRYDIKFIYALI